MTATAAPRAPGSFRRQVVLLTAAVTTVVVLLLVLLIQVVLAQVTDRTVERVLGDRTDAVISSADAASTATTLVVPDARLDAGVAVYDAEGTLVAGAAPTSLAGEYADLAASTTQRSTTVGETDRVRAQPFVTAGGVAGVVVVTEKLAPYEQAEHYALVISVLVGLLMIAGTTGLAAWVSKRALAPVADMAHTAEEWSEHDLRRRFDLGPPTNEITALGHTLDALLDKVSTAITSEQRLTSELAHELRTPLTTIQGGVDFLQLRDDLPGEVRAELEEISAGTRRMADTITGLLELARSTSSAAGGSSCDLREVVTEAVDLVAPGGCCVVDLPEDTRLGVPPVLALRALTPLVENATRLGEHVQISAAAGSAGSVSIRVDDDGPGVEASRRESIFSPGHTTGPGSGLGLALSRRIARSLGGDVTLDIDHPTTRFVLRLPQA